MEPKLAVDHAAKSARFNPKITCAVHAAHVFLLIVVMELAFVVPIPDKLGANHQTALTPIGTSAHPVKVVMIAVPRATASVMDIHRLTVEIVVPIQANISRTTQNILVAQYVPVSAGHGPTLMCVEIVVQSGIPL